MIDRTLGATLLAAGLVFATPVVAQGSWEPQRTVEMIVNLPPGGGTDRVARVVQSVMERHNMVSQPVTIVNRGGAGGGLGIVAVGQSAPDGHTVGFSTSALVSTPMIQEGVPSYAELTPLAMLSQNYVGFAVRASSPLQTPQDIIDRLSADPTSLSFAIGNAVGNPNHIAVARVAMELGIEPAALRAIVLEGGGETVTSVLGGHIDVGLTSVQNFLPHVGPDGLRIIAVSAPERMDGIDAPTWREFDIDSVAGPWYAVFGPANMGADQIAYWENTLEAMTRTEEWQAYLNDNSVADIFMRADETRAFLSSEAENMRQILTSIGIID